MRKGIRLTSRIWEVLISFLRYSSAAGPEADPFFSIRPTYTGALVEKAVEYSVTKLVISH